MKTISRRHALCCGAVLAAGLFTGLLAAPRPARALTLRNPCRGPLPDALAQHPLLQQALDGLDVNRLVDTHAHLLGNGDSGSGCSIHPSMHQWWRPTEVLRRRAILNAACVPADEPSIDRAFVERLTTLAGGFPAGARWWLFAFDQALDDDGRVQPDWTTFHVPDAYAAQVAAAHPQHFDWVCSVHPYREDALARLDRAIAAGAVAVKWLPSAMNINLADRRCHPYLDRLAATRLPLIVHFGEEKAAPGAERGALGNPLLARHALERGVRVIAAHCASLGEAADTDRRSAPAASAFELWARVMDEPLARGDRSNGNGSGGLLLGDLSAVFQRNRRPEHWRRLLQRQDWHARLLHGSDHPLPGLMPLFSLPKLVKAGVLAEADSAPLQQIREHNSLLFDLALKRRLRWQGLALPASIFEGRALQLAASAPTARA